MVLLKRIKAVIERNYSSLFISKKVFKGDLLCKMHFLMSFIHKYVSPVGQGTHKVAENKTLSLFLHTHI